MRPDFAVFIMVWGRPEFAFTYKNLKKSGYTGKIYLVADNLDKEVENYRAKYGENLLVFDKEEAWSKMDSGDNSHDLRSTLYSANIIFELAKEKGLKYFMIMCDDYTGFYYNHDLKYAFNKKPIKNLDGVFEAMIEFYENTPTLTIAMAQAGDFIGGADSKRADIQLLRKAMNSFLCSVERPFKFMGRLNEDVTTYVNLGSKGKLFFTITNLCIIQQMTQSQSKGLTDVYKDWGTYVKSFFSVMYNPSCVKVADMGWKHKRIHHHINWDNAVPKIISPIYQNA